MDEIVNRVAKSPLITLDLETYYPEGTRTVIDIAPWLYEGLILREKEFRAAISAHDWQQYKDHFVALNCSTDAIIPSWSYLLLTTKLAPLAKKVIIGNLETLETLLYQEIIEALPIAPYKNKPVIIKGCATKPVPLTASVMLIEKLQPYVKSLLFGEACSTVPLYKK